MSYGNGSQPGINIIGVYSDPTPIDVNYMSIASYTGVVADWIIPKYPSNTSTGNISLPQNKNKKHTRRWDTRTWQGPEMWARGTVLSKTMMTTVRFYMVVSGWLWYKMAQNIAENFNRLSWVHERYSWQTTTDGFAIAYTRTNVVTFG